MKLKLNELEKKDLEDGEFYFVLWESGYFGMAEFNLEEDEFYVGESFYDFTQAEKVFEPPERKDIVVSEKQDVSPVVPPLSVQDQFLQQLRR